MTTLIQELEIRQQKLAQAIQLLREIGMGDLIGGTSLMATTEPEKPSKFSPEARAKISAKLKEAWLKKKAEGKLMNPNQVPRKPGRE